MRKILVAAIAAGLFAVAGPAFAGPGGTSETTGNNVSCGVGTVAAPSGTNAQVNTEGGPEGGALVICNDGAPAPIQGRIIASGSTSGGGYVAADGDKDNPSQGTGWARVDVNTGGAKVRCDNNTAAGQNSDQANTNGGNQSYCGA